MRRVSCLLALAVSVWIFLGATLAESQSTVTPNCTGTANPEYASAFSALSVCETTTGRSRQIAANGPIIA